MRPTEIQIGGYYLTADRARCMHGAEEKWTDVTRMVRIRAVCLDGKMYDCESLDPHMSGCLRTAAQLRPANRTKKETGVVSDAWMIAWNEAHRAGLPDPGRVADEVTGRTS